MIFVPLYYSVIFFKIYSIMYFPLRFYNNVLFMLQC